MPQPTAAPTSDTAAPTSDIVEAIEEAKSLERERHAFQQRVTDNRDYLRLMDRRGKLDEAQGEWLDAFYPSKERGSLRTRDSIEKNRKVRAEALKNGSDQ